jgi:hypothetical protein
MIRGAQQVASHSEKILNDTMERQEPLRLAGRFEPSYITFSLPSSLMRNFSAIVGVTLRVVHDFAQDRSNRRRIAPQLVCDDPKWRPSLTPQKPSEESFCGPLIASRLNQDVNHLAILVHRPPEIVLLTIDPNEHFI